MIQVFELLPKRELRVHRVSVALLHAALEPIHGYVHVMLLNIPETPALLPKHAMIAYKLSKMFSFRNTTKHTTFFAYSCQSELNETEIAAVHSCF